MRHNHADRLLHHRGHGCRMESRKLANNTYLERRDGDAIAVRLHSTDIITLHAPANGTELVTLDSGGWLTMTTKGRMHDYAPGVGIESDRGVWQVVIRDEDVYYLGTVYPFADGFTYDLSTGLATPETMDLVYAQQRRNRADRATLDAIRQYVDGYCQPHVLARIGQRLMDGDLMGDCWFCSMASDDHDHLRAHIEEDYYVPSLAINATVERGYGDPRVVLSMMARDWVEGRRGRSEMFAHDLSDYLKRRLLVGAHSKRSPGNRTPTGYFGMV